MEDQDRSDVPLKRKNQKTSGRHVSKRLIVLLLIVVGAFGYCAFRYYRIVKAPLDVSHASKTQALSWFVKG